MKTIEFKFDSFFLPFLFIHFPSFLIHFLLHLPLSLSFPFFLSLSPLPDDFHRCPSPYLGETIRPYCNARHGKYTEILDVEYLYLSAPAVGGETERKSLLSPPSPPSSSLPLRILLRPVTRGLSTVESRLSSVFSTTQRWEACEVGSDGCNVAVVLTAAPPSPSPP
jgi:hypothetical protein